MEKRNDEILKKIDHSKIKDGEVIYKGSVWDVNGNIIGPIPYLEEDNSNIEENSSEIKKEFNIEKLEKRLKDIEENEITEDRLKPISFSDLMNEKFEESKWLVDGFIPFEGTTALSGSPASFKTWLILDIAIKVAKGELLFDKFKTEKMGVLIIDEENGKRLLNNRIKKIQHQNDLPIYFICLSGFKLNKLTFKKIIEISKEYKIGLIIFDSLVRIHEANENNAIEMANVFSYFKRLNKEGLTILLTHHSRKKGILKDDPMQSMRGSSDISASVECHIVLDRKKDDSYITVIQSKNRLSKELKPFNINIVSDENSFRFDYLGELNNREMKKENESNLFLEALKELEKASLLELYKKLNSELGINKIREIAKELKNKNLICSIKEFHNKEIFSIREDTEL